MVVWLLAACGGAPPSVSGDPAEEGGDDVVDGVTPGCCDDEGEESVLFRDEPVDVALELTEEAIAGLAQTKDDEVEDVPAVLTVAGESYDVGVRLKGGFGSFRTFEEKAGFRVDLAEYDDDQHIEGARRLNLQNMVQDPAMLAEHATYALWHASEVPAPRHGYARLTVNGELFGLYGVADGVDEAFVTRRFSDGGGALFEGEMDDFEDGLWQSFDAVDDGGLAYPQARIAEVVQALDAAPAGGRGTALAEAFDRDVLLDAMAVELVSANPDAYATYTNNFYVYDDPASGKLVWVEWGPDQAMMQDLDVLGDWPGRLYRECRADAACDGDLRARVTEVAETLADPEWRAWIEGVADATEADCEADPRTEASCAWGREQLFAWLDRRPSDVFAALETTP